MELILFESSCILNENVLWQLTIPKLNTFRAAQQAKGGEITDQG